MKNILLTGASGMLGTAIAQHFHQQKTNRVTATARTASPYVIADNFISADLIRPEDIEKLSASEYDVIIHTAALTNLEKCEQDQVSADSIHIAATRELARRNPDSLFIYVSTDSVFDGKTGSYSEKDASNPLNYYSYSKLMGENAVGEQSDRHYILRTNMYGFHRPARRALFEWGYQSLVEGKEISGFNDVVFNPLYVGQLAEVIEQFIVVDPPYGIYNATADESMSKFEFLQRCAQKFNLPSNLILESESQDNQASVMRPRKTNLSNKKIKHYLPGIDLSFDTGIDMLYNDFLSFTRKPALHNYSKLIA